MPMVTGDERVESIVRILEQDRPFESVPMQGTIRELLEDAVQGS